MLIVVNLQMQLNLAEIFPLHNMYNLCNIVVTGIVRFRDSLATVVSQQALMSVLGHLPETIEYTEIYLSSPSIRLARPGVMLSEQ